MNREQAREKAMALVNRMTVEEAASQLRYDAPAIERLGIPAYNWWNEALHGVARAGTATVFPQAIGMAASFDRELLRRARAGRHRRHGGPRQVQCRRRSRRPGHLQGADLLVAQRQHLPRSPMGAGA